MSLASAIRLQSDRYSGAISQCIGVIQATHPGRLLARTLLIGCLAIGVSGIGHVVANPAREESREVADLVADISEGDHRDTSVPRGLSSSLGYEPVAANGTLVKPTGGCSTPIPLGPETFEEACRTHDLGYDLLRSAEESGHRLGVWARFELDRRLYIDLLSTCETLRCRTAAATYYTAVTTNSIRQGYGAPTDEPTTPWIGAGLLVICFAFLSDPRGGLRARVGRLASQARMPLAFTQSRSGPVLPAEPGGGPDRAPRHGHSPTARRFRSIARSHFGRHRRLHRSTV